jgi:hypothetical protein
VWTISIMADKYTAGIEVSNACRQFYVSRLQTAELLKERLAGASNVCSRQQQQHQQLLQSDSNDKSTFAALIAHLRTELASLIDLDLQVMRQLLMLNEQVEELKWQRRRQLILATATPAVDELQGSFDSDRLWSRSETECWTADVSLINRSLCHDFGYTLSKYPTPSALSLLHASSQDRLSTNGSLSALDRTDVSTNSTGSDLLHNRDVSSGSDVLLQCSGGVKVVVDNSHMSPPFSSSSSLPGLMTSDETRKCDGDAPQQPVVRKRSSTGKERPPTKPKPTVKPKSLTTKISDSTSRITDDWFPSSETELSVRVSPRQQNNSSPRTTSCESGTMPPISPVLKDAQSTRTEQHAAMLKTNEAHSTRL